MFFFPFLQSIHAYIHVVLLVNWCLKLSCLFHLWARGVWISMERRSAFPTQKYRVSNPGLLGDISWALELHPGQGWEKVDVLLRYVLTASSVSEQMQSVFGTHRERKKVERAGLTLSACPAGCSWARMVLGSPFSRTFSLRAFLSRDNINTEVCKS